MDSVGATGTLEAVETVDVGTQVSGTVDELYADFNSIVKKGQVIARLDPSLIQTQIEQQRANVTRAEADLERLRVIARRRGAEADAREGARLNANLIPRTELETAEINVKTADAQIRSSMAALTQARSQLNTQEVNLGHTVIRAPIDGIIISRNVDQGQTVAASMNAPVLYSLAADLTKMQVVASIDEAEIGKMRPGQPVTFRVDAYPDRHISRGGAPGAPAADDRAERRHVLDRHQRSERGAQAEAGHDRERHDRDLAQEQRAAASECGSSVPADDRHLCRVEAGSASRTAARVRPRRPRAARLRAVAPGSAVHPASRELSAGLRRRPPPLHRLARGRASRRAQAPALAPGRSPQTGQQAQRGGEQQPAAQGGGDRGGDRPSGDRAQRDGTRDGAQAKDARQHDA